MSEPDDFVPRGHPLSRRIVAGLVIVALVLSAIAVGVAIAHAQWGQPDPVEQQDVVPA